MYTGVGGSERNHDPLPELISLLPHRSHIHF